MLLCTPRNPKSAWSKVNKDRLVGLIENGWVHQSGIEVIEAAKASGRWNALDAVDSLVVPPDLKAALAVRPPALAFFEAFPPSVKRGILEWISNAKKPATREARITETATLAASNQRANQWPRPPR
jgi:uncharacterized protein YdeI (YjbR/CyaY-like superfamily)